jgi:hypothetical protein
MSSSRLACIRIYSRIPVEGPLVDQFVLRRLDFALRAFPVTRLTTSRTVLAAVTLAQAAKPAWLLGTSVRTATGPAQCRAAMEP